MAKHVRFVHLEDQPFCAAPIARAICIQYEREHEDQTHRAGMFEYTENDKDTKFCFVDSSSEPIHKYTYLIVNERQQVIEYCSKKDASTYFVLDFDLGLEDGDGVKVAKELLTRSVGLEDILFLTGFRDRAVKALGDNEIDPDKVILIRKGSAQRDIVELLYRWMMDKFGSVR